MTSPHHAPDPGYRRLAMAVFAVALSLILVWFLRHALLIIYVSAVLAVVFKPIVDWLHRRSILGWHPGRGAALLIIVLGLAALAGGMVGIALPSLISNATEFASTMSSELPKLQERIHSLPLLKTVDLGALQSHVSAAFAKAIPAAGGATMDLITGLLLTAYLILDGAPLLSRLTEALPPSARFRFRATLNRAGLRMRRWLTGQGILMLILGGAAALTFGLMGLPYFYLLAIFAGLANIVPLLGPLATVVLAGAVAATQSGWMVLGVVIFYLVYQQIENAFLTPNIMRSQLQMSSAVVLIALLIGSELAGIAGALVAIPSAVLISELAGDYLANTSAPATPDCGAPAGEPSGRTLPLE
jgi:predicted PurR-regulated permease PerM